MFTYIAICFVVVGLVFFMTGMARVLLCFVVCIGGGAAALAATRANLGVEEVEHEDGISLRQDSTNKRTGFFVFYGTRSHMGGGIAGGK